MSNLTSGNLKYESLPAKKSLGDEGRPERPTQVNKYSERFEASCAASWTRGSPAPARGGLRGRGTRRPDELKVSAEK